LGHLRASALELLVLIILVRHGLTQRNGRPLSPFVEQGGDGELRAATRAIGTNVLDTFPSSA